MTLEEKGKSLLQLMLDSGDITKYTHLDRLSIINLTNEYLYY